MAKASCGCSAGTARFAGEVEFDALWPADMPFPPFAPWLGATMTRGAAKARLRRPSDAQGTNTVIGTSGGLSALSPRSTESDAEDEECKLGDWLRDAIKWLSTSRTERIRQEEVDACCSTSEQDAKLHCEAKGQTLVPGTVTCIGDWLGGCNIDFMCSEAVFVTPR